MGITQLVEGLTAIPDGTGNSIGRKIAGAVNLAVRQPLVLVAIIVLVIVALRRKPAATG